MKPTINIICLALLMCIISCSEPFEPKEQDFLQDVVIIAELNIDSENNPMYISTTFNNDNSALVPNSFEGGGELTNLSSNGSDPFTIRDSKENNIWIQTGFRFSEGDRLTLTTDFSEMGLESTYAQTDVPARGGITDKSHAVMNKNRYEVLEITFDIKFASLPPGSHYHFIPYITDDPILIQNTYLDIDPQSFNNSSEIFYPVHSNGILIDNSILDDQEVSIKVSSSDSSFNPSSVYLLLKTVNDDYVKYHKSLSKKQEASGSPFTAPLQTFSNIERGQGIFVAYTETLDTIPVQ